VSYSSHVPLLSFPLLFDDFFKGDLFIQVSVEKSAYSLIGAPFYVTNGFLLLLSKFSLLLTFDNLIIMCFNEDLFKFYLFRFFLTSRI
jgi:hypothetical protein